MHRPYTWPAAAAAAVTLRLLLILCVSKSGRISLHSGIYFFVALPAAF